MLRGQCGMAGRSVSAVARWKNGPIYSWLKPKSRCVADGVWLRMRYIITSEWTRASLGIAAHALDVLQSHLFRNL